VEAPVFPSSRATVVAVDRQVACSVAGEAVILQLDHGIYYGLNPVGARVWELVQRPTSIDEIVDGVLAVFEVERERCLRDIQELVADLQRNSLVSVTDESARQ